MLFLTILVFITLALKGGMYIYYFKYYLHESAIASFLENIGFHNFTVWLYNVTGFQWPDDAATSGNSLFNASGIIFMIVGIMISKPLADRFGKRDVFGIFLFLSALCLLMFCFLFAGRHRHSICNADFTRIFLWRDHSPVVGNDCRCGRL